MIHRRRAWKLPSALVGAAFLLGGGVPAWGAVQTFVVNSTADVANSSPTVRGADGPIRSVVVKNGKLLRAAGAGRELTRTLGADPNPTGVLLTLGDEVYCMSFGGTTKFHAGRQ